MFVAFIDIEKAYDIVGRKILFDVLRVHGVHEKLVGMAERVYCDNMVRFELANIVIEWCKGDSGVRQGCACAYVLM